MDDQDGIHLANGEHVDESELVEQFIRASGPGGQNVNKVATAVQLRLNVLNASGLSQRTRERALQFAGQKATKGGEILIEAGRFRTQEQNRADARRRLVDILVRAAEPPPKPRKKTRPTKGAVERRLKAKSGRAQIKKMRGRVDQD